MTTAWLPVHWVEWYVRFNEEGFPQM